MSNYPSIYNLILDKHQTDLIDVVKPAPLTTEQQQKIYSLKSACSNTRVANQATLDLLSQLTFAAVDSCDLQIQGLLVNLSTVLGHVSKELVAVSEFEESLDERIELAHMYSHDIQRIDELETHKKTTALLNKIFDKDALNITDDERRMDYLHLWAQHQDLLKQHPELVEQGEVTEGEAVC